MNREKTEIGSPVNLKFLGFKLTRVKGGTGLTPHPKALRKFKKRVREITKRNRGVSLETMLNELASYMRGWIGYFGATTNDNVLKTLDGWVRRRVRQFIFRQWKKRYRRFRALKALCPAYRRAPDGSVTLDWVKASWACAMQDSYWRASDCLAMKQGVSNEWLHDHGMFFLMDGWERGGKAYQPPDA